MRASFFVAGLKLYFVTKQDRRKNLDAMKYDKKSSALSELKAKRLEKERRDRERAQKQKQGKGQFVVSLMFCLKFLYRKRICT